MRTNNLLASTALTTSAMLASGAAAFAQVPAQAPSFNWTGFYVGLNTGGASTRLDHDLTVPAINGFPVRAFSASDRDVSFTGGFLAGYNYMFAPNWLFGIEGDINYVRASLNSNFAFHNSGEDVVGSQHTRLRWLATVRGRFGYTFANTLLYATGGLALGGVKSNVDAIRCFIACPEAVFAGSYSGTLTGYAAGVGIQQALNNLVSLRIEYMHFDLGSFSYDVVRVSGPSSTNVPNVWQAGGQVSGDIFRAAVTVKLGAP